MPDRKALVEKGRGPGASKRTPRWIGGRRGEGGLNGNRKPRRTGIGRTKIGRAKGKVEKFPSSPHSGKEGKYNWATVIEPGEHPPAARDGLWIPTFS